jgi:hypothetical protein
LATGRIACQIFHRAQRAVSVYWQARIRMSGLMKLNGQILSYGNNIDYLQNPMTTDLLTTSTFGMNVQVDKTFSVDGQLIYTPWDLGGIGRPNQGWMFTLGLDFRPL